MGVNKSDGQPVTSATSSASNNCSFSAMHIEATRGLVLVALAEEKELLSVRDPDSGYFFAKYENADLT